MCDSHLPGADPGFLEWGCLDNSLRAKYLGPRPLFDKPRPHFPNLWTVGALEIENVVIKKLEKTVDNCMRSSTRVCYIYDTNRKWFTIVSKI
jgi:hypothetical protein